MDAVAYWDQLVSRSADIDALHLSRYSRAPRFPERIGTDGAYRPLAEEARQGARCDNRPYWDVLLRIAAMKGDLTEDLLSIASKSHPQKMRLLPVTASEIRAGALPHLIAQTANDEVIVMASKVTMVGGKTKHFPMLDLRCELGAVPLRSVKSLAKWLLPTGYVLFASGRSYHLVGSEPVSRSDLSKLLVHSLYAGDLIDRKYVAHHLERGFCTLRISPSERGGCPVWIRG